MLKMPRPSGLAFAAVLAALLLAAAPAGAAKKPSKKSPHTQIVAVCRVETAPAEKVHANHRRFLEFDVTIASYERVTGDAAADPQLAIRQDRRIHVVHDLSCGGAAVSLAPGDAAEIRGEYVARTTGRTSSTSRTRPTARAARRAATRTAASGGSTRPP